MKRVLWALILAAAVAQAGTFVDTFSTGMNPAYWSVLPWPASPGIYTISNPPGGGVLLQKTGTNPGNQQNVSLVFDMSLIGGPVSGDFSMQVDFRDAVLTGGGLDQAEFHSGFADNNIFFDVLESSNVHVWTGSYLGGTPTSATSGTFGITRVGSTITGYFDGSPIWSGSGTTADLNFVSLCLQNNAGSNDNTAVTFSNFSITGADVSGNRVPEPATWFLLTPAAGLFLLRRARRS